MEIRRMYMRIIIAIILLEEEVFIPVSFPFNLVFLRSILSHYTGHESICQALISSYLFNKELAEFRIFLE